MYKYKNISDTELTIVVDGNVNPRVVQPGADVESDVILENPNLQAITMTEDTPKPPIINAVQTPQPNQS